MEDPERRLIFAVYTEVSAPTQNEVRVANSIVNQSVDLNTCARIDQSHAAIFTTWAVTQYDVFAVNLIATELCEIQEQGDWSSSITPAAAAKIHEFPVLIPKYQQYYTCSFVIIISTLSATHLA